MYTVSTSRLAMGRFFQNAVLLMYCGKVLAKPSLLQCILFSKHQSSPSWVTTNKPFCFVPQCKQLSNELSESVLLELKWRTIDLIGELAQSTESIDQCS